MASPTVKLPKVTQYVRNVGRSVAFASINAVKNNMEGIKGFAEDNEDVFVEIYSGAKNYRETLKKSERSIKDSNLYKAIEYGAKNMIEDAKTGNFYNDRTSDVSESALGLDDESLGLDFDYEVSSGSSQTSGSKLIADSFNDAMKSSTIGTTTAVAKGTDMVVRSTKASTTILSSQIEKSTATIHSGLGAVYNSVNQINQFLNGPMMAHLENSRTYYDHSLKIMQEQQAMMKEMLEMQRNLYGAQAKQYANSRLDQSMNSSGMMNLRGYRKIIKGNIDDLLSMYGIGGFGGSGINMPMLIAAAPFKIIMDNMFDSMMPKNIKKNLNSFDKIVSGVFGQFIGKMNKNKNNMSNGFLNLLSQIFGIDIEDKKTINTSKYNKGAVAFDGITRKTIIEVIPGYLARIEAALTGKGERHYDPHSGKWKTARQIESDFEKERINTIESANRSITYDIANDKRFQSRGYQKAIRRFKEQIYEDGYFDVGLRHDPRSKSDSTGRRERSSSGDNYKKYGFRSKKDFDAFLSMLSDETIAGLATSNMRAKQARSRKMQEYEDMGSIFNILFNDSYNDGSAKSGSYSSPSKYATGGLLNRSTDKYGKNVFYYLREILKGINSRWKPSTGTSAPSKSYSGSTKVRRSRSREFSTSSESEGDSGSDDDEWDSVDADLREQEAKAAEERAKHEAAKNWVDDSLKKSPIGKFFKGAINGVSKIISSPLKFINDLLEQANNNMFSLMFGDMKLKVDGKEVNNVFQFIIDQIKNKFDELGNFIKTKVFNPVLDWFKEKVKPWTEPVWNELKGMGRAAKERVKRGLSNTFGKAGNYIMSNLPSNIANKVNNGGVATADEIEAAVAYDNDGIEYNSTLFDIGANARGARYVTKRGLTMISPGEMIIPASFNRKKQNKMLALEKRDRKRIINAIGLNASGNVKTEELKKKLSQIYAENKGDNKAAKVGAGGIAGLGAGLITGFNPFLAALAGAGLSVLDNSDTLKNIVFGEVADEETGDRKGGLISKKIQDAFKKYAPDMGDFGIAGGVLGLLTPFGPFMGAAIGAGIGFLKNSEGFKKFVFGEDGEEDGLISKKAYEAFKDKVKKEAPKMLIGAGAGILTGPFGLLGNAVIGAGLGLISTTETFQNFLYGEADENGERHGGVVDAFKTGFLEPAKEKFLEFVVDLKEYSKKHIFEPMKNFWKPVSQMLKNVIQSTGDKIKDHLNDMFERTLGLPLHDFLQEKVFKPMGKFMFGILKAPYKLGRFVLSSPFRTLGGIGNSIRASQIRRGTAYDMTATERLAWRDNHKIRFNKFNRYADKRLDQDKMIASMDEDQLNAIFSNAKAGLDSYETLQKATGKARSDIGKEVSKFFNSSTAEARNRFVKVGYNTVNKLTEIAQTKSTADVHKFIDNMKDLSDEEKDELKRKITEKVKAAERANSTMELAKNGSDNIDSQLSKLIGYKVKGRKDRRKIMRSAEAELKARGRISERITESPEVNATNNFAEIYNKKSSEIIKLFIAANKYLENLVNPTAKNTDPPSSNINQSKKELGADTSSTNTESANNDTTAIDKALNVIKDKQKKSKSPFNRFLSRFGIGGAQIDEDSKEGKELKAEAEEDDERAEAHLDETKKSTSILTNIKEALIGNKETEDSGFLGKIWKGIGTVGKWLGIGGLALTGTSLFGHLSQWFKTSIWPDLKVLLFGTKDLDGNVVSRGVFGNIGYTIRTYLFGEEGTDNKGLFGNAKNALWTWWDDKAAPWLESKINGITTWFENEGGFTGIFVNRIIPGFVNGLGYAINNLLGPTIGALLKAAPSLLVGLGKAILEGIKIAFFNRGVGGSRTTVTDGGASAEYNSTIASINSTIEGADKTGTVSNIKSAFKNLGASFRSSSYEIDTSSIFKNNNANNTSSGGIMGALGQTKRTNDVEFDEDGNVITDYTRFNTTDSLASMTAKAAGRNFIKGLGGNIIKSKSAKNAGRGIFKATKNIAKFNPLSKIKGGIGFTKSIVNAGKNTVQGFGKLGSKLNSAIGKAATSTNYQGKFIDTAAKGIAKSTNYQGKFLDSTKGIIDAADNSSAKNGILGGITKIFKNIADNNKIIGRIVKAAKVLTGKEVTEKIVKEAIEKIGEKLGKTLVGKATGAALKGLGNIIAKFSPLTLATFIIDFIWGFDNADTVLGVAKGDSYTINLGHKCICGLVNMLTNFFTLGLVPADVIMDICIEYLFPIFGLDASGIKEARARAQAIMDEWNKAHPDDTYDNLQDFNNKDKWWFKTGRTLSNAWNSTKEFASNAWDSTKKFASNAWNSTKKFASNAWDSTKEFASNAWDSTKEFASKSFNAVSSKVKDIASDTLDIGKFIKDVSVNSIKAAIDPEYTWDIDSYLDKDDPLAGAKKIVYYVLKFPLGIVGTVARVGKSVYNSIKGLVLDVKDGVGDAWKDISAVCKGQYSVFSSTYWNFNGNDEDNPLSIVGKISSTALKIMSIPHSMLGYVGSKVWNGLKSIISGAKEGRLDAKSDVSAVKKGKYTIFSSQYWKSDSSNTENPISTMGSIFGFISRVLQAPSAMIGYVGTKIWDGIKGIVNSVSDGILDSKEDVDAVKKGEYTIFSSKYWKTNKTDSDNPLSLLGSVFGSISRFLQAPSAMVGWVGSKISKLFTDMIDGVKDISKDTKSVIKKAEDGKISVFSSAYWKITVDEDNPLGMLGKIIGLVQRLLNAPIVMIKGLFSDIADAVKSAKDFFSRILGGGGKSGGNGHGRSGGFGRGHIYQSSDDLVNVPYGDSTIGDSGCAPVAAANLLNDRRNTSVRDAARYAERNGHIIPGGGTSIDFFNSYLGSKGITTRNSSNRNTVMNALANGNQVIMLGKDNYDSGAPFGTNPHFITAKGISNSGNIIVEDPDLPYNSIEYNTNDVMDSMITSVIAGNGRKHRIFGKKRSVYGRGKKEHYLLANDGWTVTSKYDEIRSNGKQHKALDLYKFNNAPVKAFTDGTVKYIENRYRPDSGHDNSKDGGGFGNYVTLVDKDGYYHVYAHLNRTNVSLGQSVTRGQQIGLQGNTGRSTGSHLHYQISSGSPTGPRYNPYDYLLNYGTSYSSKNNASSSKNDIPDIAKNIGSYTKNYLNDTLIQDIQDVTNRNKSDLFTAIGNLGKSIARKIYGNNVYDALFGDSSDNKRKTIDDYILKDSEDGNIDKVNPGSSVARTYTINQIWNALRNKGYSEAGTAGIMGNMNAESGYKTNNLEDAYNAKWKFSDIEYTNAVSNKSYSKDKFANDSGGYGLVQFTDPGLKRNLYENTVEQGYRIDDMQGQINALASQLSNNYKNLNSYLKNSTDVSKSSDRFLREYENPRNPEATKQARRNYSWQAYNTYKNNVDIAKNIGNNIKNSLISTSTGVIQGGITRYDKNGKSRAYHGTGRATKALNEIKNGGNRAIINTRSGNVVNSGIDYVTLLKTIIDILISISNNTALLNKILEVLSSRFGININASQVSNATSNSTGIQAKQALSKLINDNADSANMAKLINNKDTQYLLNAMAAIASE